MAIILVPENVTDLLPVECVCQKCDKKWKVTEYKDFRHRVLHSGMDSDSSDEIYIVCPACKDLAFPPEKVKKSLMKAHEEWKFLQKTK